MQGYKLHQWHVYVLFWALLMTISLPSQAEVGPEAMLQEMTDQVLAEIRKDQQQRARFVEQFREMLLNTYLRTVNDYRENVIRIIPSRAPPQSSRAVVNAEVEQPGGPSVHLGFRLHNHGNGWLIYDISVEGISLVASHRSGFSREISERGLDGLIARLEKINSSGDAKVAAQPSP
jgi:phospholipid transport system substrate-binding protein